MDRYGVADRDGMGVVGCGMDWQTRQSKVGRGRARQTWYGADGSGVVGRGLADLAGTGMVRYGRADKAWLCTV